MLKNVYVYIIFMAGLKRNVFYAGVSFDAGNCYL